MKNTLKKNIALACMLTVGLSAAAVGGSLMGVSASAAESTFTLFDGASIRDNAPAGIRFETTISATEYADYVSQGATFGTVIIPAWKLGANTLVKGYEGSVNVPAEHVIEVVKDDEATEDVNESVMQYNAVMVGKKDAGTGVYAGLPTGMYNIKLVARSYVEIDGEVVAYAKNTAIRSFAQVAAMEIVDPTDPTDGEVLDYMHEITDYVATLEANVLDDVSINTAEENYATTITLPEDCGEVYGVYLLPSNYTIGTGAYTVSANEVTFTKEFIGSLDYGDYNLKINAENGCYSVTASIYAKSTYGDNRLIGFDFSNEIDSVVAEGEKEWLADYQGAKGVVRAVYSSSAYTGFNYKTDKTVDELKAIAWDYVTIRVYVTGSGSKPDPVYQVGDASSYLGSFERNKWHNIILTKEKIETVGGLDYFYENITGEGIELFWAWNATSVDWYIDYLDFNSYNTTGVFNFDTPSSDAELMMGNLSSTGWAASQDGANGVAYGTYSGAYSGGLTFRGYTTVANMQALDWEVLVVRVWFGEGSSTSAPDPATSNWNINGLGTGNREEWVSLCISKENLATQFTTIDSFYQAFVSSSGALFVEIYNTQASTMYVDSIHFTKYDRTMDFEAQSEINYITQAYATDLTWYETRTDDKSVTEEGVVSYNHGTTQYGGIRFQFNNWTGMTMNDWDTMEMRIRILRGPENANPGTDASFSTLYLNNDYTWTGGVNSGWSTITMSKDSFVNCGTWGNATDSVGNFWKALCGNYDGTPGARVLFESWYLHTQGGWTIEIDYISLVKNA